MKTCVVSGYLSTFRDSVLAMHNCTCSFVPGLATRFEMIDIAALVLPRPILVEAGTRDPIFPIDVVRNAVSNARSIAKRMGKPPHESVVFDEFE